MNREERIAWAKRKAAETSPERARQSERESADRANRIVAMGSNEANRAAYHLNQDASIPWLGPVSTPMEWDEAVAAARAVSIEAARRRRTITYGELRIAAYEATQMKVGHSQYAELAMSINEMSDECLLSAIVVGSDSGVPGAGFLPFARQQGYNQPLESLQRQVFEHFGSSQDRRIAEEAEHAKKDQQKGHSMNNRPTWALILEAAEDLTRSGSSPFTLDSLIHRIQLTDPDRQRGSISPTVQGMTFNATGGPRSACGEVLNRVDHGLYELLDTNAVAPLPREGHYDAIAQDITTNAAVDDPIGFLRTAYQRRDALGEVDEIIASRDSVLDYYGQVFAPSNLPNLTAEQFKSFLLYENNRHWAGIHRHQAAITADMGHLRQVLGDLLNESRPISERLDAIVRPGGANLVRGLGKAVFTPILQVVYPDEYGVWNAIAESAMKKLGLWPNFARRSSFGQRYAELNRVLIATAETVGVDLWTLDTLWWAAEQMPDLESSRPVQDSPVSVPGTVTPVPDVYGDATNMQAFTLERHLHDFLRDSWDRTELGEEWELLHEGGDLVGYEYPTGVGRIDLLAHHRSEPRWLVIELKRERSSDTTVGQVARYVGWIREHLADSDESVEGLVISHTGDDRIRYALSVVPGVSFTTYEVEFRLRSH